MLIILNTTSGCFEGDTLTLNGVSNVIRLAGKKAVHMTVSKFVEKWDKGNDSFMAAPPKKGILSVLTKDGSKNVVVELISVEQKNGFLHLNVEVLKCNVTGPFKTTSIFFDPGNNVDNF